ncbi:MAG: IS30 family transposase [Saccharofermentanales bacterium]
MGHLDYSKEARKNKHLNYRERLKIEIMLKEKKNIREISEHIGCSKRTIERERLRGQVTQLNGATWEYYSRYDADYAHNNYRAGHEGKGASLKIGYDHKLCEHIETEIKAGVSPDVIANNLLKMKDKFTITLCTRTIYNYLDKNIFLNVGYDDLIYGRYKVKHGESVNRLSYKNLKGRSIEERPASAEDRKETGHWEMDLVLGGKTKESKEALLTLTERTSRREIIRKLPDKTQASVIHALDVMERQIGRRAFSKKFLSITVDNGSEFLNSSEMERSCISRRKARTIVYYAHPYSAYERGSNENMNRMIRRFIPKGADIGQFTKKEIKRIENWLNNYPRKILDYLTPMKFYEQVA